MTALARGLCPVCLRRDIPINRGSGRLRRHYPPEGADPSAFVPRGGHCMGTTGQPGPTPMPHRFTFEISTRGAEDDWSSHLKPVTVEAFSLKEAFTLASAKPLTDWFHDE